ncbi:hypothetical protein B0H14DRAFT_3575972 [Mycena olivaceomarginata]|nr:hypothetical protein B0H14DRAFT_3575972 [Mycena olivaceomarginata]
MPSSAGTGMLIPSLQASYVGRGHAHGRQPSERILATIDAHDLHARHRLTPAPALLPATTSCVRSVRDHPFPSPSPLLLPPRAPSASPASTILPDPHTRRAHPQHVMHHHPRAQHLRQPLRIACAAVITSPPPATLSSAAAPLLCSKPAPVRHREYDAQHRRSAQQVQRAFPFAHAAFIVSLCAAPILCAHAALRSKPRPATHRERDVHRPRAPSLRRPPPSPHTLPASHVHPQRHTTQLVDDFAAPPPMRSTPCGGFPSPAPAAFAAMNGCGRAAHEPHGGDAHPAFPPIPRLPR